MKAVVQVDGGPLDGSYAFDEYSPENLNKTGLDQGSNEFFAWLLLDGAFCFGKGQVGYVQGGMSPASMQRRLAGESNFQAGPCNYWLTEWDKKDSSISARFQHVEWAEVLRFRTARARKNSPRRFEGKDRRSRRSPWDSRLDEGDSWRYRRCSNNTFSHLTLPG